MDLFEQFFQFHAGKFTPEALQNHAGKSYSVPHYLLHLLRIRLDAASLSRRRCPPYEENINTLQLQCL